MNLETNPELELWQNRFRRERRWAIVFAITTVLWSAMAMWMMAEKSIIRTKAIKGGAAYYDPQTGVLKWRHEQPAESWPAKPLEPVEKACWSIQDDRSRGSGTF